MIGWGELFRAEFVASSLAMASGQPGNVCLDGSLSSCQSVPFGPVNYLGNRLNERCEISLQLFNSTELISVPSVSDSINSTHFWPEGLIVR